MNSKDERKQEQRLFGADTEGEGAGPATVQDCGSGKVSTVLREQLSELWASPAHRGEEAPGLPRCLENEVCALPFRKYCPPHRREKDVSSGRTFSLEVKAGEGRAPCLRRRGKGSFGSARRSHPSPPPPLPEAESWLSPVKAPKDGGPSACHQLKSISEKAQPP